jgi:hypothetical protein
MKKNYFLTLLLTLCFGAISFGQVIITELADPNNSAGSRYVEIYNVSNGTVDMTNWKLKRWTNGNSSPSTNEVDLSSLGNLASGSFAIIAANGTTFKTTYGIDADISAGTGGPADSNGDDQIGLFNASDTLVDIFGVPGEDGSNTCHEFEDGRAERKGSISAANATFNESEWNVWSDGSSASGCTSHTSSSPKTAPADFDPKSWIGTSSDPTLTINSPADGSTIDATTSVNVKFTIANFNVAAGGAGDGYIKWKLDDVAQADKTDTNDITLTVAHGQSYKVYIELVDNSGNPLSTPVNKTTNFTVAHPCDLVLTTISTTCDALTTGTDTFTGSIAFTGGNTGDTYTITAPAGVVVGGDNPNTTASGTITFTNITEGTDAAITIVGSGTSSCNYARTLYSPTCVAFPVVDKFNYTADTDLIAAPNWSDHHTSSTPNNIQVKTGALTNYYTASQFPEPTGNMVSLVGSGSDPAIGFNDTSSGIVYASFLFQVTDMANFKSTTTGGYFAILAEPGGSFQSRLWVKDNTAGTTNEGLTYQVGISTGSTATFHTGFTANIAEPVFVVMAYDFGTNEAKLWVVPDATSFEGTAPAPNVTVSGGTASSLGKFILRQDSSGETPSIDVDELRIGTTWAQVTPKGTTASVEKNNIDGFMAYPNPVNNGRLTISTASSSEKEVTIFNVIGKRVFAQKFTGTNKQLDVSRINSGIYIMKVVEDDRVATKKLVIK